MKDNSRVFLWASLENFLNKQDTDACTKWWESPKFINSWNCFLRKNNHGILWARKKKSGQHIMLHSCFLIYIYIHKCIGTHIIHMYWLVNRLGWGEEFFTWNFYRNENISCNKKFWNLEGQWWFLVFRHFETGEDEVIEGCNFVLLRSWEGGWRWRRTSSWFFVGRFVFLANNTPSDWTAKIFMQSSSATPEGRNLNVKRFWSEQWWKKHLAMWDFIIKPFQRKKDPS